MACFPSEIVVVAEEAETAAASALALAFDSLVAAAVWDAFAAVSELAAAFALFAALVAEPDAEEAEEAAAV
jgi:hypothetical protein